MENVELEFWFDVLALGCAAAGTLLSALMNSKRRKSTQREKPAEPNAHA